MEELKEAIKIYLNLSEFNYDNDEEFNEGMVALEVLERFIKE